MAAMPSVGRIQQAFGTRDRHRGLRCQREQRLRAPRRLAVGVPGSRPVRRSADAVRGQRMRGRAVRRAPAAASASRSGSGGAEIRPSRRLAGPTVAARSTQASPRLALQPSGSAATRRFDTVRRAHEDERASGTRSPRRARRSPRQRHGARVAAASSCECASNAVRLRERRSLTVGSIGLKVIDDSKPTLAVGGVAQPGLRLQLEHRAHEPLDDVDVSDERHRLWATRRHPDR